MDSWFGRIIRNEDLCMGSQFGNRDWMEIQSRFTGRMVFPPGRVEWNGFFQNGLADLDELVFGWQIWMEWSDDWQIWKDWIPCMAMNDWTEWISLIG
ncbi:hypothetical protein Nepgr_016577 [Nepenthes gracilis]|uniref:Uncharacterized protein n=1 Tax=Nepenthes gracilis TaxID=150966 RepID=A0AAD3SQT5_NEPGR|nr:hypothetical protein Nepgr_016577 [Nepenthes gracilis]